MLPKSAQSYFLDHQCGTTNNSHICDFICLATSLISNNAFKQNVYLRTYYFSSTKVVEFNRSVSDFYLVSLRMFIDFDFLNLSKLKDFLKRFILKFSDLFIDSILIFLAA